MGRGDTRHQPQARPDQRRYGSKAEPYGDAPAAAEVGLRRRRSRDFKRALDEAKRTAGSRAAAARVEERMTGAKRSSYTESQRPSRRGLPRKQPRVVEKALGRHGAKGKKRAARKG